MIVGDTSPIELPSGLRLDPQSGFRTMRKYRGLWRDMVNLSTVYAASGITSSLDHETMDFYTLTVDIPGFVSTGGSLPSPDQQVITLWGADNGQDSRDAWQFPRVATEMAKMIAPEERARFRADFEAVARGEGFTYAVEDPLRRPVPLLYSDLQKRLKARGMDVSVFDDLMLAFGRGATSYRWNFPVVRKRQIFPIEANVKIDFSITNQVWTSRTLLAKEPAMRKRIKEAVQKTPGFWAVGAVIYDEEGVDRARAEYEFQLVDGFEQFFYGKPL